MWKWVKYILIFGTLAALIVLYIKHSLCRKKGDQSGVPYSCGLFCSDPTWLTIQKVFYAMNEGKCYEVTDYNKGMNYRIVELEKCGETNPVLRREGLADFEMLDHRY